MFVQSQTPSFQAQNGQTALIIAANLGHLDCVRALLERGADMEAKDYVRDVFVVRMLKTTC